MKEPTLQRATQAELAAISAMARAAYTRYVERMGRVPAPMQADGRGAVELYTNAKMTENLAMYPALGYSETGRARQDGFDRVFYRKWLRRPG